MASTESKIAKRRLMLAGRLVLTSLVAMRGLGAQAPQPPHHAEVTPELERTAFADSTAREILHRARAARLRQDSALRAYDAKSYFRLSVSMGVRAAPSKLLMRTEQAARVRWSRDVGVWVEPTARRMGIPMGSGNIDMAEATPIPYFPGRESLWFPSSEMAVVNTEVNDEEFLHPLAAGAEAYYRYETGSSIRIGLGDGHTVTLRELRITARKPDWRAFVGSFWFDVESGSLARAAYRLSADFDFWKQLPEQWKLQLAKAEARAKSDTGASRREAERLVEQYHMSAIDKLKVRLIEGVASPIRANVSAVTVEFGLFEGRFWLPTLNVAEGEFTAGFIHLPITWQERFAYESVNAVAPLAPIPTVTRTPADTQYVARGQVNLGGPPDATARRDTSLAARLAADDSTIKRTERIADSLEAGARAATARGDTKTASELSRSANGMRAYNAQVERRREACDHDSTYVAGVASRYNGAVRTAIRMPCNEAMLEHSSDLPGSIYDPNEQLFGTAARDELLASLDLGLQSGWAPQVPRIHTGLDLFRYNRIEGASIGASATSLLGNGYTAQTVARIGFADRIPNAEVSLTRSNGRADVSLGAYRRLAVANDDWGAPLSFGASLSNLLFAHDEGFYYRTIGGALTVHDGASTADEGLTRQWRVFAERETSAGIVPRTQASLRHVVSGGEFVPNIDASALNAFGLSAEVARSYGLDPGKPRLFTRARVEGALTARDDSLGSTGYGRLVLDATLSNHLGAFDVALTGAAGTSAGDLPVQRAFYVGGFQTVRGETALPANVSTNGAGRVGDSFWLTRVEIGPRSPALRPLVFYDVGWAGERADFGSRGRPLSGVGAGISLFDGLIRLDAARGLWPERQWRWNLSLGAKF